MKKERFEELELEVILFEATDVITMSGDGDDDEGDA